MSNPSGGIKWWPSRTNCRSPTASRAKAGVRRCSCGNVREAERGREAVVRGSQWRAVSSVERRSAEAREEQHGWPAGRLPKGASLPAQS